MLKEYDDGQVKEGMVSNVDPPTARGRAASDPAHKGWKGKLMNAEHSELWQEALLHERFSTSEEGHSRISCS